MMITNDHNVLAWRGDWWPTCWPSFIVWSFYILWGFYGAPPPFTSIDIHLKMISQKNMYSCTCEILRVHFSYIESWLLMPKCLNSMWKSYFLVMTPEFFQTSTVPIHRGPTLCCWAKQPRHERKNVPFFLKCLGDGPGRQGSKESANISGHRYASIAICTVHLRKTGFDPKEIEYVEMWPWVLAPYFPWISRSTCKYDDTGYPWISHCRLYK